MDVMAERPLRTVIVGDALLPTGVIAEALEPLDGPLEVIASLNWGPPDEAEVDRMALRLEHEGPTAERPPEELWARLASADLLVVHYCPVSREVIEGAASLRFLATCRAGTENLDVGAATEAGVLVLHVIGRTTEAVSDFAVGLLLSEVRNIARAHARLAAGRWDKSFVTSPFTPELEGRTIGIVGFGEVGRALARKLQGFGMRRLAFDPFVDDERIRDGGAEPATLETLIRESDFISLHARLEPGEPPLIGDRELGAMKPTAYLINTARSSLLDTDALVRSLRERRIAGAALDVHDREPMGEDHPLLELDNVTLTPHLASSTKECAEKSPRILAEDIRRVIRGERPRFAVNGEGEEGP